MKLNVDTPKSVHTEGLLYVKGEKIMSFEIDDILNEYKAMNKEALTVEKLKRMTGGRKVILYGAGYLGIILLRGFREIGIFPAAFADINPQKQGSTLEGLPVISPEEIRGQFNEVFIVVSMYRKDSLFLNIKAMLNKLGHYSVIHVLQLRSLRELMTNQPLPLYIEGNILPDNIDKIKTFYNLLSDDISRDTFISLLRFMFINEDTPINAYPINEQYFDYGIYKKIDNECFIDCGAFDGGVMQIFLGNVKYQLDRYIGFEPDPDNYKRLQERIANLDESLSERINTHNLALGDIKEQLCFENFGQSNSAFSSTGSIKVDAVRLDDFLEGVKPSFIKIDVEGCEKKVIQGGLKLINSCHPLMAVSVYHRPCDLWEIPLWLKNLYPDYRIYLRSYMNLMETVCYAVPEWRILDGGETHEIS